MGTQLIIGKPYIVEQDEYTRLCSDITWNQETHTLYYETENEYGSFFSPDLCDAFVVNLLFFAMENGADIVCESCISERLYQQLAGSLIPVISKNIPKYQRISITADKKCIHYDGTAVGTGLSCGVDSLYTVYKNLEHPEGSELRLTHLCFFNAGNNGGKGGKIARDVFRMRREHFRKVAEEIGLPLLSCDTNINDFLQQVHVHGHTLRTLAIPLAFQKLFHLYYFSSGYEVSKFKLDYHDSAAYDIFTLPNLSNENIRFVSFGCETTRIGKVGYLSDKPAAQKYLHVCLNNKNAEKVKNCSNCRKCKRTMLNIYLLDKTDSFPEIFDWKYFSAHKDQIIEWALDASYGPHADTDMIENRKLLQKRGLISPKNYVMFILKKPVKWVKRMIKRLVR